MYFLSCFVKAAAFSHCGLFMGISWEGQELIWDIGLSERQTQIHPLELSLTLVRTKLLLSWSAWNQKKPLMSLYHCTCTLHVISSGVSHNLNMDFNFMSSLLRGKVLFHVAINFSNAQWHCGTCMANWLGYFLSHALHSIFVLFFCFSGAFKLFRAKELCNLGKRSLDERLHLLAIYQIRCCCQTLLLDRRGISTKRSLRTPWLLC